MEDLIAERERNFESSTVDLGARRRRDNPGNVTRAAADLALWHGEKQSSAVLDFFGKFRPDVGVNRRRLG